MTRLRLVALRALAAVGLVLAGVAGSSAAPASADPGDCTPTSGVVVVVDFRPFGGGIERGCDPSPTTGFAALHDAGFPTVGTQHDGPGFICRIKGLPTAAADPCVVTPPASRYWSYWHSDAGQSGWSYSQLGATSYRPKPGSVDAWVYGATDVGGTTGGPTFSPGSVRATAPATTQPAPPPASTGSGSGGGGTGSGSGAGSGNGSGAGTSGGSGSAPSPATSSGSRSSGSAGSAAKPGSSTSPAPPTAAPAPSTATGSSTAPSATPSESATSTTAPPTTSATATAAATATTGASSDPPVVDVRAAPAAQPETSSTPWPTLVTLAVLAVLGALAVVLARRRRQGDV